jgi:hypothetical protein
VAGKRERLAFESIRLMSRRFQPGSRLVAVLDIIKEAGRQINLGTGRDVGTETVADAKVPLRIRWFDASYLDVPIKKVGTLPRELRFKPPRPGRRLSC